MAFKACVIWTLRLYSFYRNKGGYHFLLFVKKVLLDAIQIGFINLL